MNFNIINDIIVMPSDKQKLTEPKRIHNFTEKWTLKYEYGGEK